MLFESPHTRAEPQPAASEDVSLADSQLAAFGTFPPSQRQGTGLTITDRYSSVYEDGRTYHGYMSGSYLLPNDGKEQNRLDMMHKVWEVVMDGHLGLAPINPNPSYVLDVGTGTGVWANDFAERYPTCKVIGTDLSLIQPHRSAHVNFIMENSETEPWEYPWLFDYIHSRNMATSFTDYSTVLERAYNHLKPGGWIELQESNYDLQCEDDTLRDTGIGLWSTVTMEASAKVGMIFGTDHLRSLKDHLIQAGFVDVEMKVFNVPGSPWMTWDPKLIELGWFSTLIIKDGIDAFRRILMLSGIPENELEIIIHDAKLDLGDPNIHFFLPWYVETTCAFH